MTISKAAILFALFLPTGQCCFSQQAISDSVREPTMAQTKKKVNKEQQINAGKGYVFIYPKPKLFGFITKLPADAAGMASTTFKRKTIKPLILVVATTGGLLLADQSIYDQSQKICSRVNFQTTEQNKNILTLKINKKETTLLKLPGNINTGFYQLGQGFTGILIGAGLYIHGKIKHDYRSLSTASQLTESFILMGVGTQLMKHISGRETPGLASIPGGRWELFPSFKKFQQNTPKYDAFPSGHLATLMATVTILAQNYPEKKWIAPVGYSVTGLVGLSMINNGVHWASDFPLAIALGYLCGRQIVKNSRTILNSPTNKKNKGSISYSFNSLQGKLLPALIYTF
ncbi:hypothetical protein BH11BAC4_BH11BAC4_15180 [soil metagenome]